MTGTTRMARQAGRVAAGILATVLLTAVASSPHAETDPGQRGDPALAKQRIERGRYLTTIAACHDCHSPKADAQLNLDAARLLSGRPPTTMPPLQAPGEIRASLDLTAWAGPWGNSYAANLTPDPETGIGARYTEASFIRTIRTGQKPEGEMLAPPMPWTQYRNMTDEDLKSIYAFLKTLKPVNNAVRSAAVNVLVRR